jgi:membrane protein implicated in regulation of membrane protease activity
VAFAGGGAARASSTQKVWLSILELVLAAVLLAVILRRWQRRHDTTARRGTPAPVLRQLERLTPRRSGLLGVLIQPRSLTIAAAIIIARDRGGFADAAAGVAVFALLSTGALLGLFTYVVRRPERAEDGLATVADRIEQLGPILFILGLALASLFLLIDGVRGLAGT